MNVITEKVGPLPLVVWVALGSGGVLLLIVLTHKSGTGSQATQSNSVAALAPTQAEAFGTLEQQQQDVVNALTTLNGNQSALGGSLSSLSGMETSQWQNANAQFQNLSDGQQSLGNQLAGVNQDLGQQIGSGFSNLGSQVGTGFSTLQGQNQQLSQQQTTYYNQLAAAMQSYFNSLNGGLNGINSNIGQLQQSVTSGNNAAGMYYQNLWNQAQSLQGMTYQQQVWATQALQRQIAGQ
jgi:phage-related protein